MDIAGAGLIAVALLLYRFAVSPIAAALGGTEGFGRRRIAALSACAGMIVCPALVVSSTPNQGALRISWFVGFVVALLTWRLTTADFDVTLPLAAQALDRLACLAAAVAGLVWPPVLLVWLGIGCGRLHGWQHHAKMPTRLVKAYISWFYAYVVFASFGKALSQDSADGAFLFLAGCVSLSHYLKPAWSKIRLGENPLDWMLHNRTHHLAASAYAWGWARFVPEQIATRVLARMAPWNRVMNAATLLLETCALIAFTGRWELVGALVLTAMFNSVIAVASGILFWENITTNLVLAAAVATAPAHIIASTVGSGAELVAVAVLALALDDLVWQPDHLGWWDTPFTARIQWRVTTDDGAVYGLYNDFMSPYERDYGRTYGTFLTREPFVHGHLGIVWDRQLRDRLADADGRVDLLDEIRRQHGHVFWDEAETTRHSVYLQAMFGALNRGVRKSPLPRHLRWAKAPGGQLFYWGDMPRYRGNLTISSIAISYQERYYLTTANRFVVLKDEPLFDITIPPTHAVTPGSTPCAISSSTAAPISDWS